MHNIKHQYILLLILLSPSFALFGQDDNQSNVESYTPSVLLNKNQMDFTFFNSIYTQDKSNWMGQDFSGTRETFFTSLLQITYGISQNSRFNIGFDINFKSSGKSTNDNFSEIKRAFQFENNDSTRVGLTSIAIRTKWAPFKKLNNLSLESSFIIPTVNFAEGRSMNENQSALSFLDWQRYIWWNRIFYDKTFTKYQLFTEVDLLFRFRTNNQQYNAMDLPVSLFFSYFINRKATVYVMGQHTNRFRLSKTKPEINDGITTPANFTNAGMGGKYEIAENLILELLYTNFFRAKNAGLGETYNIGLKYLVK